MSNLPDKYRIPDKMIPRAWSHQYIADLKIRRDKNGKGI